MKRAVLIAIVAAALAPALAHAAPKPDAYYSATYNDCMKTAMATMQTRDCIHDEYDAWDKSLNQVYQALMTSREPAAKVQLRDDERAWLQRTKHKCDHAGDDEMGGSLQYVEIDQCNLDQTLLRTVYLRGLH
jgi:uncharacterized protein YecT (DUF1311 family)